MRVKGCIIVWFFLFAVLMAEGQSPHTIRGVVADSTGMPLQGASIRIVSAKDTLARLSKDDGSFILENIGDDHFRLIISLTGFKLFSKVLTADNKKNINLGTLFLEREYHQLDSFTVRAVVPISIKGDTIEYKASAFKGQPGDMVEDLIKKFPGITIDPNGQITAQGKKITGITVNGRDFFTDDIQLALKNLPSDIVKNIQLIQDYGETSRLTGIKSGQAVQVLNINTRDDRSNGQLGQASAGIGFDGHYQVNG